LIDERTTLDGQVTALRATIAKADERLNAVSQPPPAAIASRSGDARRLAPSSSVIGVHNGSWGRWQGNSIPPVTQGIYELLQAESGGRSIRWLREHLLAVPAQRDRVIKTPAGLNVALKRLCERGQVVRRNNLFYLPDTLARIERGDLAEVHAEAPPAVPFAHEMFRVLRQMGGCGCARDIVAAARRDEEIGPQIGRRALKVYRWLSKQASKGKLARDGGIYRIA
jgi:hypothetical protein